VSAEINRIKLTHLGLKILDAISESQVKKVLIGKNRHVHCHE